MLSNTGLAGDLFAFGGELRLAIFSLHSEFSRNWRDASVTTEPVSMNTLIGDERIYLVFQLQSLPGRGVRLRYHSAFWREFSTRSWFLRGGASGIP